MELTDFANFMFGGAITFFSGVGLWSVKKIIKELAEVKQEIVRHNAQIEILLRRTGL